MRLLITTAFVLTATTLLSGTAQAEEEGKQGRRAKLLEKFDANGDGKLDETERKAAREALKAKILEKFDEDGDGKLSEDERAKAKEARPKRRRGRGMRGRRMAHARGDDQAPRGRRGGRRLPEAVKQKLLKQFDENQDGKLDKSEREAAKKARKAKILEQFDEDGDGTLNEDERKAVRESRRAKIKAKILEKFDEDGDGELNEEEKANAKKARKKHKRRHGGRGGPR